MADWGTTAVDTALIGSRVSKMAANAADLLGNIGRDLIRANIPDFRVGDTVRVHAKIVEGSKERIQVFEGVVIKRHKGVQPSATFTVRKVSYNIGVERTFLVHSPRIDKIELVMHGSVRRARLFYLRPLRGKAARIRARYVGATDKSGGTIETVEPVALSDEEESIEASDTAASGQEAKPEAKQKAPKKPRKKRKPAKAKETEATSE